MNKIFTITVLAMASVLIAGCNDPAAPMPPSSHGELAGIDIDKHLAQLATQPAEPATKPVVAKLAEKTVELGKSVKGAALSVRVIGSGERPVLIIGGVHGDEPAGDVLAKKIGDYIVANPAMFADTYVAIFTPVNPDGLSVKTRANAHKVDLNRNMPSKNWKATKSSDRYYGGAKAGSEPETQAIIKAIDMLNPSLIVSIHSISGGRHCNNWDGPAEQVANAMAAANKYPPKANIGYPTPGSLGNWAGVERNIPVITLELPSDQAADKLWEVNRNALISAIKTQDDKNIAAGK